MGIAQFTNAELEAYAERALMELETAGDERAAPSSSARSRSCGG